MPDLEMWGGVECTVARIGDRFRNQVIETGHHDRLEDLDRLAALGIRTLRYPIIWETIAPEHPDVCDWRWHDARLVRLDKLGIRVIAGLIHHGSGPRYTNLLDPEFPQLLAAHAANVARRYPTIQLFTPVNEPLTTARLSGLYGHWYPHARDERSFLRALINQCKAISLAMQAIRRITPSAQLVQTEDMGKVFSTPRLLYQAEFENERRWLSLDLLCGRFGQDHALYQFLLSYGIDAAELHAFQQAPCSPAVIGINHYLTSERYLHSRKRAFPPEFAASNGRECYADLEAVRMPLPVGTLGPQARLGEVWERYRLPVAVTEVHHGCTREEQLRWLMEVWHAASNLRQTGVDIRAVTSWSLFGAVDWNSLLTRDRGCYEPGAFDSRNSPPRLTAVGKAVRSLAFYGDYSHPVTLSSPGWWHRPERFYAGMRRAGDAIPQPGPCLLVLADDPCWLDACGRATTLRGLAHVVVDGRSLVGCDPDALITLIRNLRAWAVIDTRDGQNQEERLRLSFACSRLDIRLAIATIPDDAGPPPCAYDPERSRDGALPAADQRTSGLHDLPDSVLIVQGGPNTIDVLIDLLIDGERGLWKATQQGVHTVDEAIPPSGRWVRD
jgi:dTDP-4-dehydrorhamnose reductase